MEDILNLNVRDIINHNKYIDSISHIDKAIADIYFALLTQTKASYTVAYNDDDHEKEWEGNESIKILENHFLEKGFYIYI